MEHLSEGRGRAYTGFPERVDTVLNRKERSGTEISQMTDVVIQLPHPIPTFHPTPTVKKKKIPHGGLPFMILAFLGGLTLTSVIFAEVGCYLLITT